MGFRENIILFRLFGQMSLRDAYKFITYYHLKTMI
jgi:hypothetical protein